MLFNSHTALTKISFKVIKIVLRFKTMTTSAKACFVECVDTPNKKFSLPHKKEVFLGRSEETGIRDIFISKKQVKLIADYDTNTVQLYVIGRNYSGCNGFVLIKDQEYTFKHGDLIELRLGLHVYEIVFDPVPQYSETLKEPKKKKAKVADYPIFTPPQQKQTNVDISNGSWEELDNRQLFIFSAGVEEPRAFVASFDLDWTIIRTKSGSRFPKDSKDWMFNFPNIPEKLRMLYNDGFKIVFFSNQGGILRDFNKLSDFKRKIKAIVNELSVPIQIFVATAHSIYRKPAPGMWNALESEKNGGISINSSESFFVGDAAGRQKDWAPKKPKDHSISDRLFALNLGVTFFTPEEYFLNQATAPYIMPTFDPRNLPINESPPPIGQELEIIVMVGCPASGKSHFCEKHLVPKGYIVANRDTLGSWQRCVKVVEEAIKNKQSSVVDNTNSDKEGRKRYIDIAKRYKIPCRCFVMSTTIQQAKHNLRFREMTDTRHVKVPEIIINSFRKKYEEPTQSEGFSDIVTIDLVPSFSNRDHEKLYKMFLLES